MHSVSLSLQRPVPLIEDTILEKYAIFRRLSITLRKLLFNFWNVYLVDVLIYKNPISLIKESNENRWYGFTSDREFRTCSTLFSLEIESNYSVYYFILFLIFLFVSEHFLRCSSSKSFSLLLYSTHILPDFYMLSPK